MPTLHGLHKERFLSMFLRITWLSVIFKEFLQRGMWSITMPVCKIKCDNIAVFVAIHPQPVFAIIRSGVAGTFAAHQKDHLLSLYPDAWKVSGHVQYQFSMQPSSHASLQGNHVGLRGTNQLPLSIIPQLMHHLALWLCLVSQPQNPCAAQVLGRRQDQLW